MRIAATIVDIQTAEHAWTDAVYDRKEAERRESEAWAALQAARREGQRVLAANGVPRALLS